MILDVAIAKTTTLLDSFDNNAASVMIPTFIWANQCTCCNANSSEPVLIALGVVSLLSNIPFAIIGWVFAFILVFVEVPLCTKFCPTSPKFDNFVARFENSYLRAALYLDGDCYVLVNHCQYHILGSTCCDLIVCFHLLCHCSC
ncbi:golgi apparatus membrane protein tvp18 [Lichtheimia corymbifera JMRC:FSU:9682]|uniref:Golgi apparatus membrane protein tvp18 n=1 Tax=Lichtheimia corymbifera JMRC:FSU:9682 TaxID=1263082 RepID=A0A068RN65_9FUNG|nr:golgi apparatus membrane protein tvp18 [Lichtheimia corymbifera JMRC:FSU:9682]